MGQTYCCKKNLNLLETAIDEKDLIEAIRLEKVAINDRLNDKHREGRYILKNQSFREKIRENTSKLKGIVSELEDNFYLITLYSNLEKYEESLKDKKFKNFLGVKKRFLQFYDIVCNDYNYNTLQEEFRKLMTFMDNEY